MAVISRTATPKGCEPRVGAFDDPAACLVSAATVARFHTAGAQVQRQTQTPRHRARAGLVVALVQAQALRPPPHDQAGQAFGQQEMVVTVGPGHRHPDGQARGFRDDAALHPAFAPVRWIGAAFSPSSILGGAGKLCAI